MKSRKRLGARRIIQIVVAASLAGGAPGAFAASGADAVEARAHEAWKETIAHTATPDRGCFYAIYPGAQWVRTQCSEPSHRYLPPPPVKFDLASGKWQAVAGNGNDYVATTPLNFSQVVGSFPKTTDVTFERTVGAVVVAGGRGILGPNEYTLQINSGMNLSTSACRGLSGCTIWQQFGYGTDFDATGSKPVFGRAALFMSYWLIGMGSNSCPSGWNSIPGFLGGSCTINSNIMALPDEPITQLSNEKLSASAVPGGNDTLVFTDGSRAYSFSASDSVLSLGTAWNQAEFNVFGDAGGSRADFNPGASVTVKIAVTDGSASAPKCVGGIGTTEETNNLTLGSSCSTQGGSTPYIEFTESNPVKF